MEYAGPIFLYFFFFLRPSFIYSNSDAPTTAVQRYPLLLFSSLYIHVHLYLSYHNVQQKDSSSEQLNSVAFVCWIFHFAKREFETLFVHRFSNETMPLTNLWKNCSYYWSFALVNGYLVNRPNFGENSGFFSIFLSVLLFAVSS